MSSLSKDIEDMKKEVKVMLYQRKKHIFHVVEDEEEFNKLCEENRDRDEVTIFRLF